MQFGSHVLVLNGTLDVPGALRSAAASSKRMHRVIGSELPAREPLELRPSQEST